MGAVLTPCAKESTRQIIQFQKIEMVGVAGFEPATPRPPGVCATGLRHTPPSISKGAYRKSVIPTQGMFALVLCLWAFARLSKI